MAKNTPAAPSSSVQNTVQTASFDDLLKHFNSSACEADAYAVATWMYARFPNEAKALLPRIKDEHLNYDGRTDVAGTTSEWAAALTAASTLKNKNKNIQYDNIDEAALQAPACKIYLDETKKEPKTCRPR